MGLLWFAIMDLYNTDFFPSVTKNEAFGVGMA